jgi:hypothetical protein
MRIAQVAPLGEAVPPALYGGTERVIGWLTDELVSRGHDVTLFATGDSRTAASLEAVWPSSLRSAPLTGHLKGAAAAHAASFSFLLDAPSFRRAGRMFDDFCTRNNRLRERIRCSNGASRRPPFLHDIAWAP